MGVHHHIYCWAIAGICQRELEILGHIDMCEIGCYYLALWNLCTSVNVV